ncbi:MAG: UDP-2,4-diacetamido-2,4,6-trideoxy-beta-L-altropyranose hydrolase [Deltaproteobacteria bacterium]|nr:UDP-2,4-diacetamido-2,4,6-trideoxy-beta-L-altropyranose hydrolase [Deltaproteobacteria bacterium]
MQAIPIIFRCDASNEIGWGHFRRCYALAEVAQQSGRYKVYFLTRPLPKGLDKKLKEIHATVQTLSADATLEQDSQYLHSMFDMMSRKNVIVCIDHYDWTSERLAELKNDPRVILMAFDDGMKKHYPVDFLINQNLDAEKIAHSTSSTCQQLLGPKYVMIRDEIHTLRQHPTERMAENFQFLVTLGGGDVWGHALKVIDAVRQSTVKFETHLIVGSQWPHLEKAKRLIGNHPRIHLYEDPSFFPQLLARADLALCGAGSTTYELAYLGIPMMTVALVPHQVAIGKAWEDRGIGDHLGMADVLTPELIMQKVLHWMELDQELENRGIAAQKVVDGRGKFRVLERVAKFIQRRKELALESA